MATPRLAPHTDMATHGWVARLPAGWRPYALLGRFDRPIGTWLLFLPGVWGILLARPPFWAAARLVALFGVGSLAMRAAGCVVNDLWDRDIDRLVTRTAGRPLAAGTLRTRHAIGFLAVLLLGGLLVLVQLRPACWALAPAALGMAGLYPLAKRVTHWPQAVMGCAFGFGAPMGFLAAGGEIGVAFWAVYGAAIAWDTGFDTVYAHQDRDDDARLGLGSTAVLWGRGSRGLVGLCYAATILLVALAGWRAGLRPAFGPALALPAVLLAVQVGRLDIADPAGCLRLFRSNREAGLAIAAALATGWL